MADYPFAGRYINLDGSHARRAYIEGHLAELGLEQAFRRLPAVDGRATGLDQRFPGPLTAGELGCYLSHVAALESHPDGDRHLHVLEDDAVLSPQWLASLDSVSGWLDRQPWDLFFTHVGFHIYPHTLAYFARLGARQRAEGGLLFFDLREVGEFGGLQSYIVNRVAVRRVLDLLRFPGWHQLAVDMVVKRLVAAGRLRAWGVAPFLSSVNHSLQLESTLRGQDQARRLLRGILLNDVMYVDADVARLKRDYLALGGGQAHSLAFLDAALTPGPSP